jgi:hypothetical protein
VNPSGARLVVGPASDDVEFAEDPVGTRTGGDRVLVGAADEHVVIAPAVEQIGSASSKH